MYLPEADCQAGTRTCRVTDDEYDDDGETHQDDIPEHSDECDPLIDAPNPTRRVNIDQSPHITVAQPPIWLISQLLIGWVSPSS